MSKDDSNLSQFAEEIRNILYSKNNEEKLNLFEILLNQYSANEISPAQFIARLQSLLEGNKKMILKLQEILKGPFPCEKVVSTYLEMTNLIKNFFTSSKIQTNCIELHQFLLLIIHLTINQFLPLSFFSLKLKTIPHFTVKFIQKIQVYLNLICKFPNSSILIRDLYSHQKNFQSLYFPTTLVKPSFPMQLICVAHLQIKSIEHLKSYIRCLSLFSFGFISHDDAINWISNIDPILSELFSSKKFIESIPQNMFHPSHIFDEICQSQLTQDQIQWIFGRYIYQELSTSISMNGNDLYDSMSKIKSSSYKTSYLNEIEPSISEIQSVTFFHSMKVIIKYFQTGESLNGIEESLRSLYGRKFAYTLDEIKNNLQFLLTIYEKFKKAGSEAQQSLDRILRQNLKTIELSSHEWRINYFPLMKKSYVNRQIVLNGYHHITFDKKTETRVFYFLNSFVKRFESILPIYSVFKDMLKGGTFYSNVGAALSIVYFIEMNKMIEQTDISKLTQKKLENIASLLFTADVPLGQYMGQFISNIDLPAKNFVQSLNKFAQSKIQLALDLVQTIGLFQDEFIYQIQIEKDNISISALPNYIL